MYFSSCIKCLSAVIFATLSIQSCSGGTQNQSSASVNHSSSTQPKNSPMQPPVIIKLGESGPNFYKRYPDLIRTYQSLPGLVQDYDISWDTRPRGTIKINLGQHSFSINDTLGVQTFQDLSGGFPSEGLFEFTIFSGMSVPSPSLISHDEARLKFYEILRSIQRKGWKPLVERGDARISGKERLNYVLGNDKYAGLDPYYLPTLEEWMRIESLTPWSFYADHAYLDLNFTREPTLTDPTKPGSYLISFDLKTEAEYFRSFVKGEDRHRWKELVPTELDRLAQQRKEKEAALEAEGIKIDTSYQDPPVPELK